MNPLAIQWFYISPNQSHVYRFIGGKVIKSSNLNLLRICKMKMQRIIFRMYLMNFIIYKGVFEYIIKWFVIIFNLVLYYIYHCKF